MKVPRGARLGAAAPAIVEARLRKLKGSASDDDVREAMQRITATGVVPKGWVLESARWGRFTVRGEETESFRFTRWRPGEAVELAAFPAGLFAGAQVGIERVEGKVRTVTRTEKRVVWVREWTGHWKSKRTGRYVKPEYAHRYRHLVDRETRRVRRVQVVKVKERVPVEEAVIRFTYAAGFRVADVPGVGEL